MRVCGSRLAQCLIIGQDMCPPWWQDCACVWVKTCLGQDMCHPWWHGCACVWVKICSVPYYRARYVPSVVATLCMCVGHDLLSALGQDMVARLCMCVGSDLLIALL